MTLRHSIALACLFVPVTAHAHTVLETPAPLSANDDFKSEPCGCVIGGTPACDDPYETTVYQVGQEITVTWIETVDHTGDFRISFAAKPPSEVLETDFETSPISVTVPDRQAGGPGSVTLTLPDTPCEECTIQVRQFMEGAMDPFYYTCASIRIDSGVGTGGGGPGGAGGASGTGGEPGLGGDGPTSSTTGVGGGEPTVAPPPPDEGCSAAPSAPRGAGLALAALSLLSLRRRSRRV
jgi:hypothetical protein